MKILLRVNQGDREGKPVTRILYYEIYLLFILLLGIIVVQFQNYLSFTVYAMVERALGRVNFSIKVRAASLDIICC